LRNPNADEVEVGKPGSLEDELLRQEVPDGVSRGANAIGDVRVPPALVDECILMLRLERNDSSILRRGKWLPSEEKLKDVDFDERFQWYLYAPFKP
jgi:hypothetical protein